MHASPCKGKSLAFYCILPLQGEAHLYVRIMTQGDALGCGEAALSGRFSAQPYSSNSFHKGCNEFGTLCMPKWDGEHSVRHLILTRDIFFLKKVSKYHSLGLHQFYPLEIPTINTNDTFPKKSEKVS